jgi:hypothetical protein
LGAIHAKRVDTMSELVIQLETRIVQLRRRIDELTSEADGFVAAAQRELRRL